MRKRFDPGKLTANIVLMFFTAAMLIPLLSIVNISLKSEADFLNFPTKITTDFEWGNYLTAWKQADMGLYFKNSVILSLGSAILGCLISFMAAFPIGRGHFKGSNKLYNAILASMFLPGSLVATIFIMKLFNFYNTTHGVILLMGLGGIQLNIFMISGFVKGIPRDLDEAAFIDGCGYFKYMFTIALPLMKPIIATVFIFRMVGAWNDFITSFLFLLDKEKRPLTAGLYLFMGTYTTRWTMLAACIIIIAVPIIGMYVFLQRYIIAGMTAGAIKG